MKFKDFLNHPYMAPLVQPFKGIAELAYMPVRGMVNTVVKTTQEYRRFGGNPFSLLLKHMAAEHSELHSTMLGFGSLLIGCTCGALGWGIFSASAASGSILPNVAGLLCVGTGFVAGVAAGPFVITAGVAAASLVAATLVATVPGVAGGVSTAVKYMKTPKAALAQFLADLKNPAHEAAREARRAAAKTEAKAAKLVKTYQALPEEERAAFAQKLRSDYAELVPAFEKKLADDFAQSAQKASAEAVQATVLSDRIVIDKPLKIRVRKNAPVA
ncbi:MAG: hypothetical protein GC185_12695 [Alphaproteobacteria bacterium]|nr:hypothetical protein [Alphaproteobacteria bacterium]